MGPPWVGSSLARGSPNSKVNRRLLLGSESSVVELRLVTVPWLVKWELVILPPPMKFCLVKHPLGWPSFLPRLLVLKTPRLLTTF